MAYKKRSLEQLIEHEDPPGRWFRGGLSKPSTQSRSSFPALASRVAKPFLPPGIEALAQSQRLLGLVEVILDLDDRVT